jgi:hypothetical protein
MVRRIGPNGLSQREKQSYKWRAIPSIDGRETATSESATGTRFAPGSRSRIVLVASRSGLYLHTGKTKPGNLVCRFTSSRHIETVRAEER